MIYRAGQIWSYRTRAGEAASTVRVLKVEDAGPSGTVVHVAVADVHLDDPTSPERLRRHVSHLAMSPRALDGCVTTLVAADSAELATWLEGAAEEYTSWREQMTSPAEHLFEVAVWECGVATALERIQRDLELLGFPAAEDGR